MQLPVVHDTSHLKEASDDNDYSRWVLPAADKNYETKTVTVYATRGEAELALEDAQDDERGRAEVVADIERFKTPVVTRPPCYFEHLPVAKNALDQMFTIGLGNTQKVYSPAMMLAQDEFRDNHFSSRQKGDWKALRSELQAKVCDLWSLRVPALQEAVYLVCKGAEEQKKQALLKARKKQQQSLKHQVKKLKSKVQSLRSPRPSPHSSPVASPLPTRRIHSSPELPVLESGDLPPMRPKSIASMPPAELMKKLTVSQAQTVPYIVVETGLLMLEIPGMQTQGLGLGRLSPIGSEHGSSTPEETLTPKGRGSSPDGRGSSPETTGGDIATPMVETRAGPFGLAFPQGPEDQEKEPPTDR